MIGSLCTGADASTEVSQFHNVSKATFPIA